MESLIAKINIQTFDEAIFNKFINLLLNRNLDLMIILNRYCM